MRYPDESGQLERGRDAWVASLCQEANLAGIVRGLCHSFRRPDLETDCAHVAVLELIGVAHRWEPLLKDEQVLYARAVIRRSVFRFLREEQCN